MQCFPIRRGDERRRTQRYNWRWQVRHCNPLWSRPARQRLWTWRSRVAQTETEWLCMLGWFAESLCLCLYSISSITRMCPLTVTEAAFIFPSPMGHLRLYIYGRHDEAPKQKNIRPGWGWVKGIRERKGGWMRFYRLGEQWLCCVWCLGKDRSLTNVAWYTGYWKQGQGFLPGHEFLGWSFCLIGQLDIFPTYFHIRGCRKFLFSSVLLHACPVLTLLQRRVLCYQCCNQRLRDGYVLFLSSLQVTVFLTRPWQARQLLILSLRGSYNNTPFSLCRL